MSGAQPAPLTIGGVNDGGRLRQMFRGALDEVKVYQGVLSPEEIRTMADKKTTPHDVPTLPGPYPLWAGGPFPRSADIPNLEGVEFHIIKRWEMEADGYRFLHGVALAWHKGRLYASFGHNKGGENTGSEEARGRMSDDGGKTWGRVFTIDAGEGDLAVSHGVFLSHAGTLGAFHGAYYGTMKRVHTRAYVLDEATGRWRRKVEHDGKLYVGYSNSGGRGGKGIYWNNNSAELAVIPLAGLRGEDASR